MQKIASLRIVSIIFLGFSRAPNGESNWKTLQALAASMSVTSIIDL